MLLYVFSLIFGGIAVAVSQFPERQALQVGTLALALLALIFVALVILRRRTQSLEKEAIDTN